MPRIVLKEHESERALEFSGTDATIGRDPACAFLIEGPSSKVVSARHARIFFQDSSWWVEDSSRNGTILDDERLQRGHRHALKAGQVIGLGESGPRYKVVSLDSRTVAETVIEPPGAAARTDPPQVEALPGTTAPTPAMVDARTAAIRYSEAIRAGLNVEERTEATDPSPDWLVHIVLRALHTNQRYEVRARVVKLGRAPECNVQVPPEHGAAVSRVHAEISISDGGVMLRDLGSRNGTFVNGHRIHSAHPASRNDQITLGSGGPTYAIEDLRIVKGDPSASETPESSGPAVGERLRVGGSGPPRAEPPTGPSRPGAHPPIGQARQVSRDLPRGGRTAFVGSVLEGLGQKDARRARIVVWAIVLIAAVIVAVLLG